MGFFNKMHNTGFNKVEARDGDEVVYIFPDVKHKPGKTMNTIKYNREEDTVVITMKPLTTGRIIMIFNEMLEDLDANFKLEPNKEGN